ncbi:MAG: LCP family protein [Candidatus Margulisiibacteriota bacterium]
MAKKPRRPDLLRIITLLVCLLLIAYFWFYIFMPRSLPSSLKFGIPLKRTNILVMGLDQTFDEMHRPVRANRTDTLILASINPFSQTASLLSIPRDTLADIPGHGLDRINSAYAIGKEELTISSVSKLLDVHIDRHIVIRPGGLAKIVDSLGGIKLYVEKDMKYRDTWGGLNINLKKGYRRLSGKEAHDYIRFRNDEKADIGRVERQQTFIREMFKKLGSPATLFRLPALVSAVKRTFSSDISGRELFEAGNFLRMTDRRNIRSDTLPGYVSIDHRGCWAPDNRAAKRVLKELNIR